MDDIFELRFQVYCLENLYLSASDYPSGLEIDEHDEASVHFVVRSRNGTPIGYMRAVMADCLLSLPTMQHGLTLYSISNLPPPEKFAEWSRFIVRKNYRKASLADIFDHNPALPNPPFNSTSQLIQLKVIRAAYREAIASGRSHIIVSVEPTLARMLNQTGIPLEIAGPTGDYLGTVAPYIISLSKMEHNLRALYPLTWAFFNNPTNDNDVDIAHPGEWISTAVPMNGKAISNGLRLH